jgi:hypothetical protein
MKVSEISFAHKSVSYRDSRGRFELGYEGGMLSATPYQIEGDKVSLSQSEIDQIVERVVSGIKADGRSVDVVFRRDSSREQR